jgi:hypothetical protein
MRLPKKMLKKASAEMIAMMVADAGKGFENCPASDLHPWVVELPEFKRKNDDDWLDAIDAANKDPNNKKPLLKLLLSNRALSPLTRYFLADLLNRYNFKKPRRQQLPVYVMSDKALDEQEMVALVRKLYRTKKQPTIRKAIDQVVEDYDIDSAKLEDDYKRQRNWVQDFNKRVSKRQLGSRKGS